jgi:hypothetical protein
MVIEVMCRIADGPLRPGELEVTQAVTPLVSWSVDIRDGSQTWELHSDNLAIELHFPDNTVWTGEAYPVTGLEPDYPVSDHPVSDQPVPGQPPEHKAPATVRLRGTGALRENSIPLHADVVVARIDAMLAKGQSIGGTEER